MSLHAPVISEPRPHPSLLRYLDVAVIVIGAPIMLAIGVSAPGYLIGAAAWIVLRAAGLAVERLAGGQADARRQISLRLSYMLVRLFALAAAVIVARQASGKDAGLTALLLIVFAFTIQLAVSALTRPRSR